ncbi:xanthine dehydrogenase YagR molybdenum-binding subunit [Catalinimonas alkaloidigena]|uniref:Xanthine dehydrogenase YagR molybdenum-binding subunit n=1 Tax=Catalinimonas alkaloidigena TaxID=1075417 RepID=A0A1G8Y5Z9_9BACT|nr:xanthine dehydrogenase family protein molybdopterin-binding subunit [Catalinimonas alkaloidigena]SDJ97814.1 xanthine dehydrogenase YagR molybdenum-binding subunit [Catalinimonas alkaloidigena]
MSTSTHYLGKATSRVDGRAKVTGQAKYAAEFNAPGLTYGFVVSSTIAKGKIKTIDTSKALALPGVLQVFTHKNRPPQPWFDRSFQDEDSPPGSPFRPLFDHHVHFSQQPVALVVAETFELARYAATLVEVTYETEDHVTDLGVQRAKAYVPKQYKNDPPPDARGDFEKAFQEADKRIEVEYTHTSEHHNPMEMHASTVVWEEDGTLTIYDKTQGVANSQSYVKQIFGLSKKEARVISPFVGGGFGSGLRPQYQLFMATMAALELKRSVRVTLTRQQMFSFGHRPATIQPIALGADAGGTLKALSHKAIGETSRFEDYAEIVVNWSGMIYPCENAQFGYQLAQVDAYTPLDMRAPGGVTGMFAIECAMDELAYELNLDPLELRLKNYAEKDLNEDLPFSSKELRACYEQGAEKFRWAHRQAAPRSMHDRQHNLVGWGMATGSWDSAQQPASAKAVLSLDGKLTVSSATSDIGTGTYTVMSQIAADRMGLPLENVTFKLGDSSLPHAPLQGGSWTVSSVGSAVQLVCDGLRKKLFKQAQKLENSPFADASFEDVTFAEGQVRLTQDASQALSITEIMRQSGINSLEEEVDAKPDSKQKKYSIYAHSAVFAEVKVDEDLGTIKVTRVVSAIAGGRILNPKTARNQILGAVMWGIGMALEEESVMDHTYGRFMNHNLAEYHIPVNADTPEIEVIFVEEHDDIVNPLGAKGLGEIGIVGVAAAIANAIFHATGKRVRDLPITLDKVL